MCHHNSRKKSRYLLSATISGNISSIAMWTGMRGTGLFRIAKRLVKVVERVVQGMACDEVAIVLRKGSHQQESNDSMEAESW